MSSMFIALVIATLQSSWWWSSNSNGAPPSVGSTSTNDAITTGPATAVPPVSPNLINNVLQTVQQQNNAAPIQQVPVTTVPVNSVPATQPSPSPVTVNAPAPDVEVPASVVSPNTVLNTPPTPLTIPQSPNANLPTPLSQATTTATLNIPLRTIPMPSASTLLSAPIGRSAIRTPSPITPVRAIPSQTNIKSASESPAPSAPSATSTSNDKKGNPTSAPVAASSNKENKPTAIVVGSVCGGLTIIILGLVAASRYWKKKQRYSDLSDLESSYGEQSQPIFRVANNPYDSSSFVNHTTRYENSDIGYANGDDLSSDESSLYNQYFNNSNAKSVYEARENGINPDSIYVPIYHDLGMTSGSDSSMCSRDKKYSITVVDSEFGAQ